MIIMDFTNSVLFKLLMVFIFSGIVSGSTMSMGGFIPLVFLGICVCAGFLVALVVYFEYKLYKRG